MRVRRERGAPFSALSHAAGAPGPALGLKSLALLAPRGLLLGGSPGDAIGGVADGVDRVPGGVDGRGDAVVFALLRIGIEGFDDLRERLARLTMDVVAVALLDIGDIDLRNDFESVAALLASLDLVIGIVYIVILLTISAFTAWESIRALMKG